MKLRIDDIPPEGREIDFSIESEEVSQRAAESASGNLEYSFSDPVQVHLRLEAEGRTVVVRGRAEGRYSMACSRCLERCEKLLQTEIRLVLKPASERARPGDEEGDVEIGFYDGKEIDCAEAVGDFVYLSLPFSVLCNSDCQGLCARCGANLNTSRCKCRPEESPAGNPYFQNIKIH